MTIQHPVFCRVVKDGKVIVMTVVDLETLGLTKKDGDVFFIATSSNGNPHTKNNPTITLDRETKMTSNKFAEAVNETNDYSFVDDTKGMGLGGIAMGSYWFIRKVKTIMDMMF